MEMRLDANSKPLPELGYCNSGGSAVFMNGNRSSE